MTNLIDDLSHVLFKTMGLIIKLAPLGVLGAIAFAWANTAWAPRQLGMLVALFYAAVVIFVVVVLGLIMRVSGFSLFKLLRYLRELSAVLPPRRPTACCRRSWPSSSARASRDSTVGLNPAG